jgi:hypothetical protein
MQHEESFPIPFVGIVLSMVWLAKVLIALILISAMASGANVAPDQNTPGSRFFR